MRGKRQIEGREGNGTWDRTRGESSEGKDTRGKRRREGRDKIDMENTKKRKRQREGREGKAPKEGTQGQSLPTTDIRGGGET